MNFDSPILVISTTEGKGVAIESPEVVEFEGIKFLCGKSVMVDAEGATYSSGLRFWVAIEKIATILEMPSAEEYVRRCALHKEREDAKKVAEAGRWRERAKMMEEIRREGKKPEA